MQEQFSGRILTATEQENVGAKDAIWCNHCKILLATAQLHCASTEGAAHLCWDSPSPGPRHQFRLFGKEWSCPLRNKFSSQFHRRGNPSQKHWCSNSIVGLSVLPLILLWTHTIIPWPKRIYATAWFLRYFYHLFSLFTKIIINQNETGEEKPQQFSFRSPWIALNLDLLFSYFFQAALHVWGKDWCAPNQYVITCARNKWVGCAQVLLRKGKHLAANIF